MTVLPSPGAPQSLTSAMPAAAETATQTPAAQSSSSDLPAAVELLTAALAGQSFASDGAWIPAHPVPGLIAASGSGTATVTARPRLPITASGSGTANTPVVASVLADASGSGTATVAGIEQYLRDIAASGEGSAVINAGQTAAAEASGSGSAVVDATAGVTSDASGDGTAVVTPTVMVEAQASGTGAMIAGGEMADAQASGSGTAEVTATVRMPADAQATGSGTAAVTGAAVVAAVATGTGESLTTTAVAVTAPATGSGTSTATDMIGLTATASGTGTSAVNAAAARPALVAVVTGTGDANATSSSISMPSASTGDLLLVEFQADANQTSISTSSSGWTKIGQYSNSSQSTFALFAGIQGTAAALTVTQTSSAHRAWTVRSIKNWSGTIADIEVASTTNASTNINPPTLTPSHGSQPYLWGAIGIGSQNSTRPTAGPSGWSNFVDVQCNATADFSHVGHGDAWLEQTGSSIDPPAFTSASSLWLALTIAIK